MINFLPHCPPLHLKLHRQNQKSEKRREDEIRRQRRGFVELLATSHWGRNKDDIRLNKGAIVREGEDPFASAKTTYKIYSAALESKIPGGSSVRLFEQRSLKATGGANVQPFRVGSISSPVAHRR